MAILFNSKSSKTTTKKTLAEEWNLNMNLTKKEQRGLAVISSHIGKRAVFEAYLKTNSEMAEKYLKFISQNQGARYVKWDKERQKFTE